MLRELKKGEQVLVISTSTLSTAEIGDLLTFDSTRCGDHMGNQHCRDANGKQHILIRKRLLAKGDKVVRGAGWDEDGYSNSGSGGRAGVVTGLSKRVQVDWHDGTGRDDYRMNADRQDLARASESEESESKSRVEYSRPEGKSGDVFENALKGMAKGFIFDTSHIGQMCRLINVSIKIQENTMTREQRAKTKDAEIVDIRAQMVIDADTFNEKKAQDNERIDALTVDAKVLRDSKTDREAIIKNLKTLHGWNDKQAEAYLALKDNGITV